jgi:ATP sulfurylase
MKNKLILGAALLVAAVTETLACTNFIVGKNASTDGSVIVSYSACNIRKGFPGSICERITQLFFFTCSS